MGNHAVDPRLHGQRQQRCYDGANWYTGAFNQADDSVSATCWLVGRAVHIRVYATSGGMTTGYCRDGDGWTRGGYTGS